jgi:hypothetical protein
MNTKSKTTAGETNVSPETRTTELPHDKKNNRNTNDANARHEEINRTAAKIAATIN